MLRAGLVLAIVGSGATAAAAPTHLRPQAHADLGLAQLLHVDAEPQSASTPVLALDLLVGYRL